MADRQQVEAILKSQLFFVGSIFCIILFFTLYVTRSIVVPLIIAILFDFLLSPSVKFLKKCYIPPQIGSALIILLLFIILGFGIYSLSAPAIHWMNKGPEVLNRIDQKEAILANLVSKPINALSMINTEVASFNQKAQIQPNTEVIVKESPFMSSIFTTTWQLILELGITVILLYFLLLSDNFLLRKIVNSLSNLEQKKEAVLIAHEIGNQVWKYLFARTVINIIFGVIVSLLMYFLGMPDPILWGVLAGLLEFIPYVGALISTCVIGLIALLSFNSIGYSFLVILLYFSLLVIEGNIISPIVFGKTLTLNPIIVFLGLLFWGMIWGLAGAFLAVPMMVTMKIIFETLYESSFMNELLAD